MKISVIGTTYNRKDFLSETIKSVQKSILAPLSDVTFEYIIYDDCSTDGTEKLFSQNKNPDIKYIHGKENKGPSFGRNRAIEESTGDYIFLIDSDDIILQRTLYKFAVTAINNPNTDWFIGDFLQTDKDLRYLIGQDYYIWKFKDINEQLTAIFRGEHFIQSSVFFKKKLFEKAGKFDESMRMTEDLDLFVRFLFVGSQPIFCDFPTHLHRHHGNNLSSDVTLKKHSEHVANLIKKYRPELEKRGIIL